MSKDIYEIADWMKAHMNMSNITMGKKEKRWVAHINPSKEEIAKMLGFENYEAFKKHVDETKLPDKRD